MRRGCHRCLGTLQVLILSFTSEQALWHATQSTAPHNYAAEVADMGSGCRMMLQQQIYASF